MKYSYANISMIVRLKKLSFCFSISIPEWARIQRAEDGLDGVYVGEEVVLVDVNLLGDHFVN